MKSSLSCTFYFHAAARSRWTSVLLFLRRGTVCSLYPLSLALQVNQGGFFDLQLHFLATGNPPRFLSQDFHLCNCLQSGQPSVPITIWWNCLHGLLQELRSPPKQKILITTCIIGFSQSQEMDNNPRYGFRSLLCPFSPHPLHLISIAPKSAPLKCH